ncbi:hypothetical protein [Nostoc sp.]
MSRRFQKAIDQRCLAIELKRVELFFVREQTPFQHSNNYSDNS